LVWTTTTVGALPAIVEPDVVIELDAMTAMYCGTVAGGPELFPGGLVHGSPQFGGLFGVSLAKPLKLDGAEPPLKLLTLDQCAPQKVTVLPTVAFWSPMTNDP
jgi:hypothetical protein